MSQRISSGNPMKCQQITKVSNQENGEKATGKAPSGTAKYMASDRRKSSENVKRQAESSPSNAPTRKRSALGDMTNATVLDTTSKKSKAKYTLKPKVEKNTSVYYTRRRSKESSLVAKKNAENIDRSQQSASQFKTSKSAITDKDLDDIVFTEESQLETTSNNDSINDETKVNTNESADDNIIHQFKNIDLDTEDEFAVSEYANVIFKNMKKREEMYVLTAYMSNQPKITESMRAILVDWLVEVQENFELYHETLYLAVKIVDHYLEKNEIERDQLQLLGATAVFLACKIEERHPPYLDDFLFICDDAYNKSDLLKMEIKVFAALQYCLAIPIPYRFLRRYAKAADANMETLTLARYILETSLLEYDFVPERSSKMAAACLYLAIAMKNLGSWTPTLQYYSGYCQEDLKQLTSKLNALVSIQPKKNLKTVHSKYSHPVFFKVAKIPVLDVLTM